SQGYIHTKSARVKVRHWFSSLALEESLSEGRGIVAKELQRLGQGGANMDELAKKLGFAKSDDLFIAAARSELNLREFQTVARGGDLLAETVPPDEVVTRAPARHDDNQGIL
ncbi:MAG TPA: GTP pyrophosphokinase, partial [Rhodocyclaceae bacterium]|nr:GTP pyrophosphokinase [Rhodocyclaceae bacterium]